MRPVLSNLHLHINCNHWENDFAKLYEVLNHARQNESALTIGDCNARLGEAELHGFDQQLELHDRNIISFINVGETSLIQPAPAH